MKNKGKNLANEFWRMLPDDCKKIMRGAKKSFLESIEADINHAFGADYKPLGKPSKGVINKTIEPSVQTIDEKVHALRTCLGCFCSVGIEPDMAELIIRVYELILIKRGATDLMSCVKISCEVNEKYAAKNKEKLPIKRDVLFGVFHKETGKLVKLRPTMVFKNKSEAERAIKKQNKKYIVGEIVFQNVILAK